MHLAVLPTVSLSPSEIHQHVVILWRTDQRRIKFTWVQERWGERDIGEQQATTPAAGDNR